MKYRPFVKRLLYAAAVGAVISAPARAELIDFNSLPAGTVIDNDYFASGVTISADNFNSNSFNIATLFNTAGTTGPDADLQGPFSKGTYARSTPGGNILIIQDQTSRTMSGGKVASPNDEGGRPAGVIYFDFVRPISSFGFDLIDVEGPEEYGATSGFFATFFGPNNTMTSIGFEKLITNSSAFYRPGVEYGNNSANKIAPFTAASLGLASFQRVAINFGGSGGIDNVNYEFYVAPEPTSFAIGAGAISLLTLRRRNRR